MASNRAPTETSALRHSAIVTEGSGFAGHLRCASLADLVQLECLSGGRTAISVRAGDLTGHLFFDGGALVHAEAGELVGNDAAFAILGWSHGTFGQSPVAWPSERSIDVPWQQLLMISAQRRDEELRDRGPSTQVSARSTSRLVAVPASQPATTPRVPPPPPRRGNTQQPSTAQPIAEDAKPITSEASGGAQTGSAFAAVRVCTDGRVLAVRGDGNELVELTAYVRRLVDLMGNEMGLGDFSALECRGATRQLLFVADSPETTLAVEASVDDNVVELGRRLLDEGRDRAR